MAKKQQKPTAQPPPRSGKTLVILGGFAMIATVAFVVFQSSKNNAQSMPPKHWRAVIINAFPHDPKGFCQGLVYDQGSFLEGTGEYGKSTVRRVEVETGRRLKIASIGKEYFGEGITKFNGRIYQLTWHEKIVLIHEEGERGFSRIDRVDYPFEGWGITHDGSRLITSDGTSILRYLDPETLEVLSELPVRDGRVPVTDLNELEYIDGEIYANVWKRDWIVRISPETGQVTGWIDCTHLRREIRWSPIVDAFNGIAWDPDRRRLFVTGKNWSKLFEIDLVER